MIEDDATGLSVVFTFSPSNLQKKPIHRGGATGQACRTRSDLNDCRLATTEKITGQANTDKLLVSGRELETV